MLDAAGKIIHNVFQFDESFPFKKGPQLKAISTKSAGIDYVDLDEVKRRNISLGSTPIVLNDAVADIGVGLMLAAARRFHEGRRKIENGQWNKASPTWMLGQDIKGSVVGIVGLGGIGQEVVRRLKGFKIKRFIYSGHKEKPEGNNISQILFSDCNVDFINSRC